MLPHDSWILHRRRARLGVRDVAILPKVGQTVWEDNCCILSPIGRSLKIWFPDEVSPKAPASSVHLVSFILVGGFVPSFVFRLDDWDDDPQSLLHI